MEKETDHPYEYYWYFAATLAQEGMHDRAHEVIQYMMEVWPERVIARGELAKDTEPKTLTQKS